MRFLWTLLKVMIGLAIAIPVTIIALAAMLGILGALVGLAVLALKLALFALVAWALVRVARCVVGGRGPRAQRSALEALPPADPHYEAAMRELDRELGDAPRA